MKLFKEEIEYRRDRNRHFRFGGWRGLFLKILIIVILFLVLNTFSGENIKNFLGFFGYVPNTSNEILIERN